MPKATVTEPAAVPVVKECPKCHSTMFQGPYYRGSIIGSAFKAREELYNCVGCHVVLSIAEMQDRVPLAAEL